MIYIFTIGTNQYSNLFINFKNTIDNFYPNKDKTLVVFSNRLQEYNHWKTKNTFIEVISIPHLLYSTIMFSKGILIEWYCNNHNVNEKSVIYYFDIDTLFYENCEFACNNLENLIKEKNTIIFSKDPNYLPCKYLNITNRFLHGLIYKKEEDPIQPNLFNDYTFIDYGQVDLQASFFCGTLNNLLKLNNKFNEVYNEILYSDRVIPEIWDEDIYNYIWLQQLKNNYNETYLYVTKYCMINMNPIDKFDKTHFYSGIFPEYIELTEEDTNYIIVNQKFLEKNKDI